MKGGKEKGKKMVEEKKPKKEKRREKKKGEENKKEKQKQDTIAGRGVSHMSHCVFSINSDSPQLQ